MSADLRPQDGAQTVTIRERSLETSINSIGTTDQASTCKENIIIKMSTNHNEAAGTCNSSADIGSQSHDREIGRNHASAKAIEGRGESIPDMLKLRRPSVSSTELAVNGGECESTPDMLKTSKTDFVHCSRCDTSTGTIGGREHSLVQCFHCEASTGTVDGRECLCVFRFHCDTSTGTVERRYHCIVRHSHCVTSTGIVEGRKLLRMHRSHFRIIEA